MTMDKLTLAEQAEYERIKCNLEKATAFCEKHGIDQLEVLGLRNKHSADSIDGGCQMPKISIKGYCCVCGSPNRTCQPEKQPTQNSND